MRQIIAHLAKAKITALPTFIFACATLLFGLNATISPDLIGVLSAAASDSYDPWHSTALFPLYRILESQSSLIVLNAICSALAIIQHRKQQQIGLLLLIVSILAVLRLPTYVLKDNFLAYALIAGVALRFRQSLDSWVIAIFLASVAATHSLLFGLISAAAITAFSWANNGFLRSLLLALIPLLIAQTAAAFTQLQAVPLRPSAPKASIAYISDLINITKRTKTSLAIDTEFRSEKKDQFSTENCIREADERGNPINPRGVSNIDHYIMAGCVQFDNPSISLQEIFLRHLRLIYKYPKIWVDVKIEHGAQLFSRPTGDRLKRFLGFFLGPATLVLMLAVAVIFRIPPIPLAPLLLLISTLSIHLLVLLVFAPGYDYRYTFPQFISGILLSFLILEKKMDSNESKNKNTARQNF